MKNRKFITHTFALLVAVFATACSEDDLSPDSIFEESSAGTDEFDTWLIENYTYPYNIDFKYKLEDIETDMNYQVTPANEDKAMQLAKLVKFCWLEAYDEVAGINFTRTYVPRIIHLVGSAAYNSLGYMVLGTAEGGLKITLYYVNELNPDPDYLNYYYFKTMHHEFAHILHQTKNYDPDYEAISAGNYIGVDWMYLDIYDALEAGFISPYSMSEPQEDFVEMIAVYITNTSEYWDLLLSNAGSGADIILQKFEIVRSYLRDSWNIDIDELRDVVLRRTGDIDSLDLDNL